MKDQITSFGHKHQISLYAFLAIALSVLPLLIGIWMFSICQQQ